MPNVGDTINISGGIASGVAPGGAQYKTGAGATKIIGSRTQGGQLYYNIDQTGIGGGTGWVLGSSISGAVATTTPPPQSAQQVTPYLNDFQTQHFDNANIPEVKVPTIEEFRASVTPSTPRPEPLNRVATFESLRTAQGVADLENSVNDLKAQQAQLDAEFRQQKTAERGKTVPQNVIEGRIGQEERAYLERKDYLGQQIARVTDQLNTKYNLINTYMNLYSLDYQDAVQRWDSEYKQNFDMYTAILGQQNKAVEQATTIAKIQEDTRQFEIKQASANLTTFMNAIKDGNLSYSTLSPDQQLLVNKMEVQAGLPIGIMSQVKLDPKANIVFQTENAGIVTIGIRNADGGIDVQKYGTATSGKPTEAETKSASLSKIENNLRAVAGRDTYVSPQDYSAAISDVVRLGYTREQADQIFSKYKNPTNKSYRLPGGI